MEWGRITGVYGVCLAGFVLYGCIERAAWHCRTWTVNSTTQYDYPRVPILLPRMPPRPFKCEIKPSLRAHQTPLPNPQTPSDPAC